MTNPGDVMEVFHVHACGRHVTLMLDPRLYDAHNRNVLSPYDYFDPGKEADLTITLRQGRARRAVVDEDFRHILYYRQQIGSHIIRQLVCLLATYHSRTSHIVHGTGLLVSSRKNEGILLVGPSHAGKSTLSQALGNFIMDDDLMLVERDTMRVTGRMGFVTYYSPLTGKKMLNPLAGGRKEARLSLVLILDKSQPGGKWWEIDNTIPRQYTVLADLPPRLKAAYLALPPIRVEAPIYRLGTHGHLEATLDRVRQIVDQHI
jgi:hypothetical protein